MLKWLLVGLVVFLIYRFAVLSEGGAALVRGRGVVVLQGLEA